MSDQLTLDPERDVRPPTVVRHEEPSHMERVALRKLGNPPGFRWYKWEAIGPDNSKDCLMTGCVVTRTYTKGKKKGRPVYDGPKMRVVVTGAEVRAERARYEAETGKCGECLGTGETWAGWDHVEGHKYRQCAICKGAGVCRASA